MTGEPGHPSAWRRCGVALLALTAACTPASDEAGRSTTSASSGPGVVTVVTVVDGDTVEVAIDGRTERVRLIGIDTPETVHPTEPVECFGPEASARLGDLLPAGTEVDLVGDVEERDRYDRLLAYVLRRADDLFVNLTLVAEGYAAVLPLPPNTAFADDFAAAEAAARTAGLGQWGRCGAGSGR